VHGRDIILLGASAGALPTLQALIPLVPSDLHAAVVVMVHRADRGPDLWISWSTSCSASPTLP
jgi:chemotaxis response regulator CheB